MTERGWDGLLDALEEHVELVLATVAAGDGFDDLPAVTLPHGDMPPMDAAQRARAERLQARRADAELQVAELLTTTMSDIRDLGRRRRATVAYASS